MLINEDKLQLNELQNWLEHTEDINLISFIFVFISLFVSPLSCCEIVFYSLHKQFKSAVGKLWYSIIHWEGFMLVCKMATKKSVGCSTPDE